MFGTLRVELNIEKLVAVGYLEKVSETDIRSLPNKEGFKFDLYSFTSEPRKYEARVDYQNFDPALWECLDQTYSMLQPKMSWHGLIPSIPERSLGFYERGCARAFLDASEKSSHLLKLIINSTRYDDLRELYLNMRRGTIKPRAGDDWSAEQ